MLKPRPQPLRKDTREHIHARATLQDEARRPSERKGIDPAAALQRAKAAEG